MRKSLKFIIMFSTMLGLALTFFIGLSLQASEVTSSEVQEPTTQEEEPQEEEETTEQEPITKEEKAVVDLFIERLNKLSWKDAEAIIGWIITYFVLNIGVIGAFGLGLIKSHTKSIRQSDVYQQAMAKLDAEHQQKVEEMINNFEKTIDDLKSQIEKSNEEHKQELKEAQNEQTKVISTELSNVIKSLNE